jgi:hypothetical protein
MAFVEGLAARDRFFAIGWAHFGLVILRSESG